MYTTTVKINEAHREITAAALLIGAFDRYDFD